MGGRLTGVSGGLEQREREQIATRLGVATMTVISGARRCGRSWQRRGAAIVVVLVALACRAKLADRMGAAGAVSDLWGPPRPRVRAALRSAGQPLSRTVLRQRLRVNNARLGVALQSLQQRGLAVRSPDGWHLLA